MPERMPAIPVPINPKPRVIFEVAASMASLFKLEGSETEAR